MPEEPPDQLPLIPSEQIVKKKESKNLDIDPNKDPASKRGKEPYPVRNIYYEKSEDLKNEVPPLKGPAEKPEKERLLPWEESTKRLKELIKTLEEKDKKN